MGNMEKIDKKIVEIQYGFPFGFLTTALGEVLNDTDISLSTFTEMISKDETIASGLEFFINHVLNYLGEYTHPDEVVQKFVKINFERIEVSYRETLEQFLKNLLAYGFAVMEKVYEEVDGKIYLKKIIALPSDTVTFVLRNGEIEFIRQITLTNGFVDIPRWKCIVATVGSGVYGESKLRRVYRMYAFKKAMIKFWAIAMERFAMPITHGKAREPELLKDALANIWSSGIIVTDPGTEVTLLESKDNIGDVYKQTIDFANVLIYRGLLLPQLLSSTSGVGSYALGKIHLDLFLDSVLSFAEKIKNVLIDQLISDLIDWNFVNVNVYGKFVSNIRMSSEELEKLSNALANFLDIGVIDYEDVDWIRMMAGFPERKADLNVANNNKSNLEDKVWQDIGVSLKHTKEQKI